MLDTHRQCLTPVSTGNTKACVPLWWYTSKEMDAMFAYTFNRCFAQWRLTFDYPITPIITVSIHSLFFLYKINLGLYLNSSFLFNLVCIIVIVVKIIKCVIIKDSYQLTNTCLLKTKTKIITNVEVGLVISIWFEKMNQNETVTFKYVAQFSH